MLVAVPVSDETGAFSLVAGFAFHTSSPGPFRSNGEGGKIQRLLVAFVVRGDWRWLMAVTWSRDVDRSLDEAREQGKPLLLDFSAAPA